MHHSILLRNNDVISISKISFISKHFEKSNLDSRIFPLSEHLGEENVRLMEIWMKGVLTTEQLIFKSNRL